jgi:hypothetical protein
MRHLNRNTASGAEAAGCAHGAHGETLRGAHHGCVLFLEFLFYANGTLFRKIQNQKFYDKLFRDFFGIPENAQKRPKKGEFHGILKWWKIQSNAVRGLRISGFLRTPQNGPFYYK